tara:strand:- start:66 stop:209 length:144 start_codon:yes stop_codon:yes gene_type:complete
MIRALIFSLGYALLMLGIIIMIYSSELFWVGASISLAGAIQFFKDLP